MNHSDHSVPAELQDVEQRLRDSRPELDALKLDAIKRRAMTSAARTAPSLFSKQKGFFVKSRLAVTMMLVLGLLMSGTGATLAVSGLSDSGSAGSAQYDNEEPGNVLGQEEAAASDESPAAVEQVQPARQVSSNDSDTLPFTGFLAIPVLLGGVSLLAAGAALRRRSGKDDANLA